MPQVCREREGVSRIDASLINQARLSLVHRLAGVENQRGRIHAARVGIELRARQAQRILRARQRHIVGNQGQRAVVVRAQRQLGVCQAPVGGTVVAITIGVKMAGAHHITYAVGRSTGLSTDARHAVVARNDIKAQPRRT